MLLEGFSFGTDQGVPAFCGVLLVEGSDSTGRPVRILVDPAHIGRRRVLLAELESRGLAPTDIDLVVLTHSHWDHVQNIDLFHHAPLLIHPDERRYASHPDPLDWATPSWTGTILEQLSIREIGDGAQIIPGVTVLDLPGHSVGSLGLAVETDLGLAVITGDALHNGRVLETLQPPLVFWDAEAARRSVRRVIDVAELVYPGHDRPFRIMGGARPEYLSPFHLALTGLQRDNPGLEFAAGPSLPWVMQGAERRGGSAD